MCKTTSSTADFQTFPSLFSLDPVKDKMVIVDFDAPQLSSLGGLMLVRNYEKSSSRIIERIESCVHDPRFAPMVIHSQEEMIRQRIYQVMAGFEDADDCDRLGRDGILKMCCGRTIIVRGDSHFCSHDFMDWATERNDDIHFITGLSGNVKLQQISERFHYGLVCQNLVIINFQQFFFRQEDDGLLHNLELHLILNDVVLLGVAFADCPGDEPFELGVLLQNCLFLKVM